MNEADRYKQFVEADRPGGAEGRPWLAPALEELGRKLQAERGRCPGDLTDEERGRAREKLRQFFERAYPNACRCRCALPGDEATPPGP